MNNGKNSYAVVFTYRDDTGSAVYLFDSLEEAKTYLVKEYEYRSGIDMETEYGVPCSINASMTRDNMYAKIETVFDEGDEPLDVVEIRVANVYLTDKQEVESK